MKSEKPAWVLYNKLPRELKKYVLKIYLEEDRKKNTKNINSVIKLAGTFFEKNKTVHINFQEYTDNSFIHFLNGFNICNNRNHKLFNTKFKWKWQIVNDKIHWTKMCMCCIKFFFGRQVLKYN